MASGLPLRWEHSTAGHCLPSRISALPCRLRGMSPRQGFYDRPGDRTRFCSRNHTRAYESLRAAALLTGPPKRVLLFAGKPPSADLADTDSAPLLLWLIAHSFLLDSPEWAICQADRFSILTSRPVCLTNGTSARILRTWILTNNPIIQWRGGRTSGFVSRVKGRLHAQDCR